MFLIQDVFRPYLYTRQKRQNRLILSLGGEKRDSHVSQVERWWNDLIVLNLWLFFLRDQDDIGVTSVGSRGKEAV